MIKSVFIINEGLCLFSRQYGKKKLDSNLISGFLTAIRSFAKEMLSDGEMNNLSIGEETLSFFTSGNLIFVINHNNLKQTKLETLSNNLINKFIDMFDNALQYWDGEISVFSKFDNEVDYIMNMKGKPVHTKMHDFALNF